MRCRLVLVMVLVLIINPSMCGWGVPTVVLVKCRFGLSEDRQPQKGHLRCEPSGECSVLVSRKATSMLRCGSAPLLVQTRVRYRRHTVSCLPPRGTTQSVMEFYHDSDHWRSATSTRLKTRRTMVAQAISNAAPLSRATPSLSRTTSR